MARMSIDDALLRDPRVKDLAERLGWHRHQVIGCLLDVWAVCYDRVSPVLTQREIDFACEVSGFCALMIATKLAAETGDEDGSVRVAGVAKRIGYLESSAERGREGGKKSGESRRTKGKSKGPAKGDAKGSFDSGEGSPNPLPSASAPDTASASVPDSARPPPDPIEPRRREASAIWREFQDARQRVARELSQVAPILAENDQGRTELGNRLRDLVVEAGESLESAAARCRHALARAAFEAKRAGNLDWFGGGMWSKVQFDRFSSRPLETQRQIPVLDLTNYVHPFEGKPLWEEQE